MIRVDAPVAKAWLQQEPFCSKGVYLPPSHAAMPLRTACPSLPAYQQHTSPEGVLRANGCLHVPEGTMNYKIYCIFLQLAVTSWLQGIACMDSRAQQDSLQGCQLQQTAG